MFVFEKKTQKQTCYFVISDIQFPLRHNHLGAPPHGLCPAASAPLANCSAIMLLLEPGRRLVEITMTFFIFLLSD